MSPSTEHGLRDVHIRTDHASATWFEASVDRTADGLAILGDTSSKDMRRAKAVGILAQPQRALDLFDDVAQRVSHEPKPERRPRVADSKPDAVLHVHLTDHVLNGVSGPADVEGVGPVTARQAQEWLGHCHVTVRPVLDIANQARVDGHEPPAGMREAVLLRSPVDCFPYATGTSRRRDLDHTIPYLPLDQGGQRGQTRTDNLAPLGRRSHRVKTHGRWKVWQVDDGVLLWRSPRGRHYLVDRNGTHPVTATRSRSRAPADTAALN